MSYGVSGASSGSGGGGPSLRTCVSLNDWESGFGECTSGSICYSWDSCPKSLDMSVFSVGASPKSSLPSNDLSLESLGTSMVSDLSVVPLEFSFPLGMGSLFEISSSLSSGFGEALIKVLI